MRKSAFSMISAVALAAGPAYAQEREAEIIQNSAKVLTEMQAMPDLQVPDWLLQRAQGIAILPEVVKAGAFVGGRGGTGVLLVRQSEGDWSNPLFIGIGAGSIGWQFGVQAADVVLVFTTRKSIEGITDGKITLGGDASAVAGPVGRSASAATSVTLDAEIYSYSRAKGLFAGVSLEGSVLFIRDSANERFYGKSHVIASEIIAPGTPLAPEPAPALIQEVARITSAAPAAGGAAPAAPEAAATTPAAAAPPTTPPADAQTFPMADPNPGAEPN
jgi:lipid-binding SYLF domain-containing protein